MINNSDYQSKCPSCINPYDVRVSTPAFHCGISRGKKVYMIFVLCPRCDEAFNALEGEEALIRNRNRIVLNVFSDKSDTYWSVTTSLHLMAHHGNHVSAILYGIDIPRSIFDAYNDGLIEEITFLPGGGWL